MQDLQSFPAPAKINLFLHITGRRTDGYHLLQTVFQLLDFGDTIYLKPNNSGHIKRTSDIVGVSEQDDLCVRAARLLQEYSNCSMGVDIGIEKRIPMGGGLGGGSSDAATVLLALNRLWNLHLDRKTLITLGLKLGADVPIFIFGQNAWAEGVGEQLQAITLPDRYFVVITPNIHVSTAEIFASKELTRDTIPTTMAAFSEVTTREKGNAGLFHNDMQMLVCRNHPEVKSCLEFLSKHGAAIMTGSGSSVFVAFESKSEAEKVQAELKENPDIFSNFKFSSFLAYGLSQHPLYNFAD